MVYRWEIYRKWKYYVHIYIYPFFLKRNVPCRDPLRHFLGFRCPFMRLLLRLFPSFAIFRGERKLERFITSPDWRKSGERCRNWSLACYFRGFVSFLLFNSKEKFEKEREREVPPSNSESAFPKRNFSSQKKKIKKKLHNDIPSRTSSTTCSTIPPPFPPSPPIFSLPLEREVVSWRPPLNSLHLPSIFQFTVGVSVPVSMNKRGSVVFSSAFQFNYRLPSNLSQLEPTITLAREARDLNLQDAYDAIESLLDRWVYGIRYE